MWLLQRVAAYLQLNVEEISADVSLLAYGIDSVTTVSLCGELQDLLNIPIDPTLVWDYQTIDAIVDHLYGPS